MNQHEEKKNWSLMERAIIGAIPILAVSWAAVVNLSGRGINWTAIEWDFQRTALLGDSFGVVSAVMATAAASFTFITLQNEKSEVRRLRRREYERDVMDQERDAEGTFFQLLTLRNTILERIERSTLSRDVWVVATGQRALSKMAEDLSEGFTGEKIQGQAHYNNLWKIYEGQLGHFLRFTYHIIRFVSENFRSEARQYEYVRLLRAQLSNSEIIIIAVNSMFGAGAPKMKEFIEKFGLLHNLPDQIISDMFLKNYFETSAFGLVSPVA